MHLIDEDEKPSGGWIAIDAQSIFLPGEFERTLRRSDAVVALIYAVAA